jgi:hypothetical protein
VTLVEKRNQIEDTSARIVWPAGAALVHAFGGKASDRAIEVLGLAYDRLRRS